MDENGLYDGWINFSIIIEPNWYGIDIFVKGNFRKYQHIKEYLVDIFYNALTEEV